MDTLARENKLDWPNHVSHHPSYPLSTVKLITEFHRAHSNSLRLAHNAGSGSGVFGPILAEYFDHVHISDPSSRNISLARESLSRWYAQNWWRGKFTFSTCQAEDVDQLFASGSVDFTSLLDCAHWIEAERTMTSVAKTLAPNGTLGLVHCHPIPRVIANASVDEAVQRLFAARTMEIKRAEREQHGEASVHLTRGIPQGNTGLDHIPLPEHLFIQDVTKRITINAHGRGAMAFVLPGQEGIIAPSHVSDVHRKYAYAHPDPEAEGWRQEVDAAWFRELVNGKDPEETSHSYEGELKEIQRKIEEIAQESKTVTIEWTVAILLATKK